MNTISFGIKCYRSKASIFGAAENWMHKDGVIILYSSLDEAQKEVDRLKTIFRSPNVNWLARPYYG